MRLQYTPPLRVRLSESFKAVGKQVREPSRRSLERILRLESLLGWAKGALFGHPTELT